MSSSAIRSAPELLRKVIKKGEAPLPIDGEENVLITSALPYCNNVPHLGNIIGSTLSADVFARYNRARNRKTLYVCGTDEYGTATETQALKEGKTPRELCDHYHKLHKETYEWFELDFDYFGRTSTPAHTQICQEIYLNLRANNYLKKDETVQVYCEGCQKFLADRFVEGICPNCSYPDARGDQCDSCSKTLDTAAMLISPRCIIDPKNHIVTTRNTKHMYVRLDLIQPQLEQNLKDTARKANWTGNAVISSQGEIVDWRLRAGLKPSPITRDLKWGVPVPPAPTKVLAGDQTDAVPEDDDADEQDDGRAEEEDDEMDGKVFYVWYDAPIGYPSITANFTPEWKRWWFNPQNVKLFQFMGKDNVYFHTVFWPSVLIGDGRDWTKLWYISSTEFLNYESGKFSKSRNVGVFGPSAKETGVPPSVWRYYLVANRPENGDSVFSWNDFVAANNSVLLNNFGNFVNRALKFIAAFSNSTVPDGGDLPGIYEPTPDDPDESFISDINALLATYVSLMESLRLREALHTVMQLSARGNLYLQQAGLSKHLYVDQQARCDQVLHRAVNLIWVLSSVVWPFMPAIGEDIEKMLNAPARAIPAPTASEEEDGPPRAFACDILPGHRIGKVGHLFKKIEDGKAAEWRERFGGEKKAEETAGGVKAEVVALSKKAAEKAKKAAKKASGKGAAPAASIGAGTINPGAGAVSVPETEEIEAAKKRVDEQGVEVRELKAKKSKVAPGTEAGAAQREEAEQIAEAVKELLRLKEELALAIENAKGVEEVKAGPGI